MKVFSCAFVTVLISLIGCGDDAAQVCERVNECAQKAGQPFSVSECKREVDKSREEAETVGCGDEFDDYLSCVNDTSLECSDSRKVDVECGAKSKALQKCGGTSLDGSNACDQAAERIRIKVQECGGKLPENSNEGSEAAECTEEAGAAADKAASDFEALDCETVKAAFPNE